MRERGQDGSEGEEKGKRAAVPRQAADKTGPAADREERREGSGPVLPLGLGGKSTSAARAGSPAGPASLEGRPS